MLYLAWPKLVYSNKINSIPAIQGVYVILSISVHRGYSYKVRLEAFTRPGNLKHRQYDLRLGSINENPPVTDLRRDWGYS